MDFKEIGINTGNRIGEAQERDNLGALVVMNLQFP